MKINTNSGFTVGSVEVGQSSDCLSISDALSARMGVCSLLLSRHVCVCVCVCVLQVHVSLLALSPSVHSPAAHNTALLHTKLHTNEHTAIKQMTWFKASDWYPCLFFFFFFFFTQLIKPMKSWIPSAVFTTKLLLSAAAGLTYLTGIIGSHYFQNPPKTAQTHCCAVLTQQIMSSSSHTAAFPI